MCGGYPVGTNQASVEKSNKECFVLDVRSNQWSR